MFKSKLPTGFEKTTCGFYFIEINSTWMFCFTGHPLPASVFTLCIDEIVKLDLNNPLSAVAKWFGCGLIMTQIAYYILTTSVSVKFIYFHCF